MEFLKPDLSNLPIMPEHYRTRDIMEKFTRISPCVVEGEPDAHNAYFVVGAQSFCITAFAQETAQEASWWCWQFAKALEKFKYD